MSGEAARGRVFQTRAGLDKLAGLLRGAVRFCCDVIAHEGFGLSCMRAPVAGRPFERSLHGRINRPRASRFRPLAADNSSPTHT